MHSRSLLHKEVPSTPESSVYSQRQRLHPPEPFFIFKWLKSHFSLCGGFNVSANMAEGPLHIDAHMHKHPPAHMCTWMLAFQTLKYTTGWGLKLSWVFGWHLRHSSNIQDALCIFKAVVLNRGLFYFQRDVWWCLHCFGCQNKGMWLASCVIREEGTGAGMGDSINFKMHRKESS